MKPLFRHHTLIFATGLCACGWLLASGLRAPAIRASSAPGALGRVPTDPAIVSTLQVLLQSSRADVQASALEWIARDPRAQASQFVPQIFACLSDKNSDVHDQALANLGWILDRYHGSDAGDDALSAITAALKQNTDHAAQLAALELIGGPASQKSDAYFNADATRQDPLLLSDPAIRQIVVSLVGNPQSSLRPQALALVRDCPALWTAPGMPKAVSDALLDDELSVRNAAADLLIRFYTQGPLSLRTQAKPLLAAALNIQDPNVRKLAAQALGVPVPPPPPAPRLASLTGEKISMADVPFDFNYFTAFIQPLFVKNYNGQACIDCHTPSSADAGKFRILAPDANGRYTLQQSEVNFVSLLAVINRKDPMQSRLLLEPLNPTTREGAVRGLHHDGGVFWQNQYDPDFQLMAAWLKGAKLEDPPGKQLDFAYFEKHVEPIFSTPGPDGFACVNCHFSHAILHLESPDTASGKFSISEVVNNYQSALRVVDQTDPSDSYIVRKPTSPREGALGGLSHAGGIRWPETKESWQYKALISWIGMPNLATNSAQSARVSSSASTSRKAAK
jgi:hypothetical protein